MNYRHAFHAGNHADVFKHLVLSRIIKLLSQKETPFAYLDTHSGVGLYDLYSSEAERTGEWLTGIKPLFELTDPHPLVLDYINTVKALNASNQLKYYPGSPKLAQQLMRPQDTIILNEKHPEDFCLLKRNFKNDRRTSIHNQNGWLLTKALLPTKEKRLLILIDPPFEQNDELELCVKSLSEAITRMRQAVVCIWYPIKDIKTLNNFYNQLKISTIPKLLRVEFMVQLADNNLGLNGSGMVIANPPWQLENELSSLMPYVHDILAGDNGKWKLDWLIEESSGTFKK